MKPITKQNKTNSLIFFSMDELIQNKQQTEYTFLKRKTKYIAETQHL